MTQANPYTPPTADLQVPTGGAVDESSALSAAGRFSRLSYLGWTMLLGLAYVALQMIVGLLAGIAGGATQGSEAVGIIGVMFMGVVLVATFVFSFIFAIRRCHDFNASGWWSLLLLVPLANLAFYFTPGTPAENRFGPPRLTRTWEKVLGLLLVVAFAAGLVAAIAIPAYFDYMERAQEAEARLGALVPFLTLA